MKKRLLFLLLLFAITLSFQKSFSQRPTPANDKKWWKEAVVYQI